MGKAIIEVEPDAKELLQVVQRFCVDEVEPLARQIDEVAEFFPGLLKTAGEIGLQSLITTDTGEIEFSGLPLAHETNEIIASYSGAVALAVSITRLHAYLLCRYARPEIRDRWLPGLLEGTTFGSFMISEPHAGTDVRAITTVARRDGDDWVISGEKAWITQSPAAQFGIVLAKIDSRDRDADTGAFVVDYATPGLTVGRDEPMAGFRGVPMANVMFDGVRVPDEARLEVDGFNGMLEGVNLARLDAASYGLGFMRGCLRACADYTTSREAFGAAIADLQLVQAAMGQMLADYLSSREMVLAALRSFMKGDGGDVALVSAAKLVASEAAMRSAVTAVQLLGGSGMHMDYPVQRFMRDSKVIQIIDGTSQIHLLMLGRSATRIDWAAAVPQRKG
jgi:alkylation response protein AidB-like acyl-CoA dehydrogenase